MTKIHIPQLRSKRVFRPHLVARLQKELDKKLILISTPPGYGKTTLIAEWISSCKISAGWVSLDHGDNDPAQFWNYLSRALQAVCPSLGKSLANNPLPNSLSTLEAFLIDTINAILELNQQMILVLDDYHNIQAQIIHQGVAFLINNAPDCFHMVIATRADPPLALARLRERSQMAELRQSELRFSNHETAEFMRKVMGLDLSESDLQILEQTTEGWIAGLQMAGLSLQGKISASDFIRSFSGEDRYIMDFLFEEVINLQSEEIQSFLFQTSILERCCAPLCDALMLKENSEEIITFLERNNLFLTPLDEQRKWYRYHFLFRDLLRNRLTQSSPGMRKILHQRACLWYETEGYLEIAIFHALAAGDFEKMASLLDKISRTVDFQNQQAMLTNWLEKLPDEVIKNHPWLCVYRAWGSYWIGHRDNESMPWITAAEKAIDKNDPQVHQILGSIAAIRAHLALISKDIPLAFTLSRKALELLPESDGMRCEAAIALAGAYWSIGDVLQTKKAFEIARDSSLKMNYKSMAAGVNGFIALQQIKQGLLDGALDTLQQGLRYATLPEGHEMPIAGFNNCILGDILRERNQLEPASAYFTKGLHQCRRLGQPDILCDAYIFYARYLLAIGDLKETHHTLDIAEQLAREAKVDPWILCALDECRIKTWDAEKNISAIKAWVDSCELSVDSPLDYQYDLHHQNLARALVILYLKTSSEHHYQDAHLLLDRLQIASKLAGWINEEIKMLILKAVNFNAKNLVSEAYQSLAQAILLAYPGKFIRVFVDEGDHLHELIDDLERLSDDDLRFLVSRTNQEDKRLSLHDYRDYLHMILSHFTENSVRDLISHGMKLEMSPNSFRPTGQVVERLTVRELEVLTQLANGHSDKKIAENLVIAPETVHKHLKNIYSKLDVHSRTEAVVKAQKTKILP